MLKRDISNIKNCPDIIITDINMPGMNGLELIKKIRSTNNEVEIIILSAHTNTEYFLEAVKLNLVSYLIKPIKSDDIRKIIFDITKKIKNKPYIKFADGYKWDKNLNTMFKGDKKVNFTNYETSLIQRLIKNPGQTVFYEDLHYYIYSDGDYSQDAITSLVKRIRKKIPKDLIKSCYKEGYKIEI